MTVLYVILLAIVQGITEFLPVSSFGHLCFVQNLLGMEHGPGVLLETMLHLGTLAAIFMTFQKDIRHLAFEALDMFMDLIGNANLYIHNRRTGDQLHYTRIISNVYRKFVVLLLVSMIPTVFLGYTARRLVSVSATSVLIPGLTISAGLMSGFSRTFAVKYSYILSIPAIIGAMIMELGQFGSADMTVGLGFAYVFGMIIAAVIGMFAIRTCLRLVHKGKFRYFAYYCFLAGYCPDNEFCIIKLEILGGVPEWQQQRNRPTEKGPAGLLPDVKIQKRKRQRNRA